MVGMMDQSDQLDEASNNVFEDDHGYMNVVFFPMMTQLLYSRSVTSLLYCTHASSGNVFYVSAHGSSGNFFSVLAIIP